MPVKKVGTLVNRIRSKLKNRKPSGEQLARELESENPVVRIAALERVWDAPSEVLLQGAIRALERDISLEVQKAAAAALGRYIWSGMQLDELLDAEFGFAEEVRISDVARARAALTEAMGNPRVPVALRLASLEALSYDPDERVVGEIDGLWKAKEISLRRVALRCMGRASRRPWRPVILSVLDGSVPELLDEAVEAAGDACLDEAEPALMKLATGSDTDVALAAIWAMRNVVHTDEGRRVLEKLARSRDRVVKGKAKEALEDLDAVDMPLPGEFGDRD